MRMFPARAWRSFSGFVILLICVICAPALALQPDEIALVVNRNVPEGQRLAEYYAQEREIPADRIIVLDVPAREEMSFEQYERDVVPPIRAFLRENGLEQQVKCLVTFFGVPIRIADNRLSEYEREERRLLQQRLEEMPAQIRPSVAAAENLARELDPGFSASTGETVEELAQRAEAALTAISQSLSRLEDVRRRVEALQRVAEIVRELGGGAGLFQHFGQRELTSPDLPAEQRQQWEALQQQLEQAGRELGQLRERRFEPEARSRLREVVREHFGAFIYAQILQAQELYLRASDTAAAVDNELALLWWDYYPRSRWQLNPLHHRMREIQTPPVVMVMRLDGPEPSVVRDLIMASIRVEQEGLRGVVALDSRGLPAREEDGSPHPYGHFDQLIRDLAELLESRTELTVVLNDAPEVFPPDSVRDVAIYCGWYSLRNYVPGMSFNPGAVGFHIASEEMVSLRREGETGWVRGLLSDGVVATVGPVREPFLHSFPLPMEFFPLLLTGELTLAEVYWKTTPLTSWMISAIGDPLYRPFKENPALKREDLPAALSGALD
jgi:uncharacterized protein (TIGR03790 family)